jgi:hypothetical protein
VLNNSVIEARIFGALFSKSPSLVGRNEFALLDSNSQMNRVEPDFPISGKAIQVCQLESPQSGEWHLRFANFGSKDIISFNSSTVSSIAVTIPNVTSSTILIWNSNSSGFLCPNFTMSSFELAEQWNVFEIGYFVRISPTVLFSESSSFIPILPAFHNSQTLPILESSLTFASIRPTFLNPSFSSIPESTAASNIGLIVGIVVGFICVTLAVIGFAALKHSGKLPCADGAAHRRLSDDSPRADIEFVSDSLGTTTVDTTWQDTVTYEGHALDLPSGDSKGVDHFHPLGLSLL